MRSNAIGQVPSSGATPPPSNGTEASADGKLNLDLTAGGGAQADFDSLIDLIVSTIAPDTWDDVGGDGSIQGFPGGVYVDTQGVLRQLDQSTTKRLEPRWQKWNLQRQRVSSRADASRRSELRKVSLVRLLHLCQQHSSRRLPLSDEMHHLAGLEQIDFLIFDRATGDCIIAGPAGPWQIDQYGRHVATESRHPVVRLEDLIVMLGNAYFANGHFLCTITPTQEGLAQAQEFIASSSGRPIAAGQRDRWLDDFRSALGLQRIEVEGIDANTRAARIIVEADHHMKRIGIGLEPGTDQVPSYLDRLVESGEIPEQMDVLRWWFTLHAEAVRVCQPDEVYGFGRQSVQVLSENELLTLRGHRVHTGQSQPLNERFARDFTANFPELARRYPVYAELDNLFRLALVAAIVRQQGLPKDVFDLVRWLKSDEFPVTTARAPTWVESIVNHRQVNRRTFVAAVSGGVQFAGPQLDRLPSADDEDALDWNTQPPSDRWWWD